MAWGPEYTNISGVPYHKPFTGIKNPDRKGKNPIHGRVVKYGMNMHGSNIPHYSWT